MTFKTNSQVFYFVKQKRLGHLHTNQFVVKAGDFNIKFKVWPFVHLQAMDAAISTNLLIQMQI